MDKLIDSLTKQISDFVDIKYEKHLEYIKGQLTVAYLMGSIKARKEAIEWIKEASKDLEKKAIL